MNRGPRVITIVLFGGTMAALSQATPGDGGAPARDDKGARPETGS